MEKNDKYVLFKNFMINELGISKDDIKQWIKDSCQEIATNMVNQSYEKFNLNSVVKDLILSDSHLFESKTLRNNIVQEIAKLIAKEVNIKINDL
jgi:hypothetical protein